MGNDTPPQPTTTFEWVWETTETTFQKGTDLSAAQQEDLLEAFNEMQRDLGEITLEDLQNWAKGLEPSRWLGPIDTLLDEGNTAMRWLQQHDQGNSINAILSQEAALMENQERELSSIAGADLG